jgi:4-hydroxy-3-methylbut-2-enyl diphosphate reductase
MLEGKKRVAVTSGASTPTQLTRQVIQHVETFGKDDTTPLAD